MRAAVLLAAFFTPALALVELYLPSSPVAIIKELKKSTVTLMEVKVYIRQNPNSLWEEAWKAEGRADSDDSDMDYAKEERDVKVEMMGLLSKDRTWKSLTSQGHDNYCIKNVQYGSKVNFFWTTLEQGYHMFMFKVFSENMRDNEQIGVDVAFYEGRPEDPSIYSHVDSQVKHKEKRLFECISISKEIIELQNLDHQDEEEFADMANSIFRIIVFSVFLKLGVFAGSFFFINKKIHQFYVSKKIIT